MEPFRIEGLEVNQIGPFEYLKLDFPQKQDPEKAEIHIFTGENGTGKTTLLESLVNCLPISNKNDFARKFWNNLKNSLSGYGIRFNGIEIQFYGDGNNINPNRNIKELDQYTRNIQRLPFAEFNFALFAYSGYRRVKQVGITSIQEVTSHPLDRALDFNHSINPQLFIQWIANEKTKEALSTVRGHTDKASQYKQSIERIENAISEIIESKIKFELEDNPLRVNVELNNKPLDFDLLPDGLKSIISWISDLLMRLTRLKWQDNIEVFDRNIILFLDEIEVHLHPAWQRKILPVVQKLFKNAQIFVSTHSPFVVGSVDGAWVYRFDKTGQYATLAEGFPMLSEDAKSYDYILEEVFGIKERFGIEVEKKLAEFKLLKNQLLRDEPIDEANFRTLVHELASQSTEIESIIGMELRQLKRITNKDFWELTTA